MVFSFEELIARYEYALHYSVVQRNQGLTKGLKRVEMVDLQSGRMDTRVVMATHIRREVEYVVLVQLFGTCTTVEATPVVFNDSG